MRETTGNAPGNRNLVAGNTGNSGKQFKRIKIFLSLKLFPAVSRVSRDQISVSRGVSRCFPDKFIQITSRVTLGPRTTHSNHESGENKFTKHFPARPTRAILINFCGTLNFSRC